MFAFGYKKSVERCSVYLTPGIAKRLVYDRTVHSHALSVIINPRVAEWINDGMSVFMTAVSRRLDLAISE